MTMTDSMWWAFHLLALLSVYMIAERFSFLIKTKPADELTLNRRVRMWRVSSRYDDSPQNGFGWLSPLLAVSHHDPEKLWLRLREMRRLVTRSSLLSSQVGETAMLIGLFGTMWGIRLGGGRGDPQQMIAVGIGSSVYGLLIAISLYVFGWLSRGRASLLIEQVEDALEVLDPLLDRLLARKLKKKTAPMTVKANPQPALSNPPNAANSISEETTVAVQAS